MDKLAVGVIGAGNMGYNHLRVYSEMQHTAHLVGFFDPDKDRAAFIREKFSLVAFDSISNLLDNVQAVSVVTPTSLHYEHGMMCADKGVHAMMEKPIAASYDEGRALNEAFKQKGLTLQVGHIERFNPAVAELGNIVRGVKVLAVSFNRLSVDRRILDASIVHDLMIHDIDLMFFLNDSEIKSVYAEGIVNALGNNSVDYAKAMLKFENGVVADLTASRITEDKIRTITVHADGALIQVDCVARGISISRKTTANMFSTPSTAYKQENVVEKIIVPQYEPLRAELTSFVESAAGGMPPAVSGEMGLRALQLADTIYGRIVR